MIIDHVTTPGLWIVSRLIMLKVHPLALGVGLFGGSHGNLCIVGEGERYEGELAALPCKKVEELSTRRG